MLHVVARVPSNYERFGTHSAGLPHGHPGVNAKRPGLIAASSNHSSIACSANQNGLAVETTVHESLDRHEKGVEVEVKNGSLRVL